MHGRVKFVNACIYLTVRPMVPASDGAPTPASEVTAAAGPRAGMASPARSLHHSLSSEGESVGPNGGTRLTPVVLEKW